VKKRINRINKRLQFERLFKIALISVAAIVINEKILSAQQAVYISGSAQIFSYPKDTISIFGNVINDGSFGTSHGSVVNFLGDSWQNAPIAELPGDGAIPDTRGGLFRFIGGKNQQLAGGYNLTGKTGPSFPNLSIENHSDVGLMDLNDLHVRGTLSFKKGYLLLNGWNTIVDDSVKGYSRDGFVVTGPEIGGGSLYLQPPSSGQRMVFPVGTSVDSYSPLALSNSNVSGHSVGARVFDQIYASVVSGAVIDSDFVRKTWRLSAAQGVPQTTIWLQHRESQEGVRFAPFRDSSYVTLYRRDSGLWDMDPLPHRVENPGTLTTGRPRNGTYLNDRIFPEGLPHDATDSINWLSVSTVGFSNIVCPLADFKLWAAQRYNHQWVQLFWRTLRELNMARYEVQRRRDTGTTFQTIATLQSKGLNGFSDHLLYYYYADDDIYDGWTYYRLKMTSPSGCIVYTNIQEINYGIDVEVWPNPSPGESHVRVQGIQHPIIMQLVDTWGQVLRRYTIDQDGVIDIRNLSDAAYFLVFYDPKKNNKQITTVKLIVQRAN
jgi:hypothetical protein